MNSVYDTETAVNEAKEQLEGIEFDTFVGTGLSGSLMIPALAKAFDVDFLMVRKKNDGSHSSYPCEGYLGERWIFVDDLISSGRTFDRVARVVRAAAAWDHHRTELVGAYLYESVDFRPEEELGRWKLPPLRERPTYTEFREGPYDGPPSPHPEPKKTEEPRPIDELTEMIKKQRVPNELIPDTFGTPKFDRPKMDPDEKRRLLMQQAYGNDGPTVEPGSFAEWMIAPENTPFPVAV
ncbi:phosphoribosyltransferase [Nocardia grenadensis]|uniref:phosphoribosyltransferase n=1 Tax=Nocardia grenadensis TaxID=931537 RepID=UPI003D75D917